jgi:hypothetical protein
MNSGENKKIILLRNVSIILCGLNGFLALAIFLLSSLAYFGISILIYIYPIAFLAWGLGLFPIFIVIFILIISIPLTIYKKYEHSIIICFIGGFLTLPLGILGLIAMILIDRLVELEIEQQKKAELEIKKYNYKHQAPMREEKYCSTCCLSLRYIERHGRYCCDNCDKYE